MALCGVVLATWALRELLQIKNDNTLLKNSRMVLIEQLRLNNREIRSLRDGDSTTTPPPPDQPTESIILAKPNVKHRIKQESAYQKPIQSPGDFGLPYLFNNGSQEKKLISLTFDGGSHASASSAILDTLASRRVRATMFLTGQFIRTYPTVTRAIIAAGHECGNHTYGHPHLTTYAANHMQSTLITMHASLLREHLIRAEELFLKTTGSTFAPIWRAPYGEVNNQIARWAQQAGYLHIGWKQGRTWRTGLDSNDWIPDPATPGYHTPQEVLTKILHLADKQPNGINGGIILMHLGTERTAPSEQVHTILGTLIDALTKRGYRFVPITEMIAESGNILAQLPEKTHIQ